MNAHLHSSDIVLEPLDNTRLVSLCGQCDEHLRSIERFLGVEINNRGNIFQVIGDNNAVEIAVRVLQNLYSESSTSGITPAQVELVLQQMSSEVVDQELPVEVSPVQIKHGVIKGRGATQLRYINNIRTKAINFGIGPAGTGKTYLAVASAVEALEKEEVRRLLLVRPAVEAGERLGFLPGDLSQKIDPYLRPLYDALYEMLGFEKVAKLIENNVIEIAPLAYMRGRTLNESFIILDEAQNTTPEQMKMFLTRIGFGSTVVITGDVTQIDLPRECSSGLRHVIDVLKEIDGISFTFFQSRDVVRHPLVQRIVNAYEKIQSAPVDSGSGGGKR
ncbi:MAG: PhoH family protein [Gammaproteobacteria bacterium]